MSIPVTGALLAWWELEDCWEDLPEDYESEAHAVADRFPAMPGDIILHKDGDRTLVRRARIRSGTIRSPGCRCGGCYEDVYEYVVWVDADEIEEVIAKGGGVAKVIPVQEWWGSWPPKDCLVIRDGVPVYEPKEKDPEGGTSAEDAA